MLELDRRQFIFKIKNVYFADHPYDVKGVDWLDFIHIRKKVDAPGFERQEWCNGILDLTKGSDHVWDNMASKYRADIRKGEKEDIVIEVNKDFAGFIKMNEEFRKAKHLAPNYTELLHEPLPDYCLLMTAKSGGKMSSGLLFVKDDKEMYGVLAASRRLEMDKEGASFIARTNRLLWWETVQWSIANGYGIIDMGNCPPPGSDPERAGIAEFKIRFGATPTTTYVYRKLYTRRIRFMKKTSGWVRSLRGEEDLNAHPCSVTYCPKE